jgi:hypothetical protein
MLGRSAKNMTNYEISKLTRKEAIETFGDSLLNPTIGDLVIVISSSANHEIDDNLKYKIILKIVRIITITDNNSTAEEIFEFSEDEDAYAIQPPKKCNIRIEDFKKTVSTRIDEERTFWD